MEISGIVNRIYHKPTEARVFLVMQGPATLYELDVPPEHDRTVGLTKPGDDVSITIYENRSDDGWYVRHWLNKTLRNDLGTPV